MIRARKPSYDVLLRPVLSNQTSAPLSPYVRTADKVEQRRSQVLGFWTQKVGFPIEKPQN